MLTSFFKKSKPINLLAPLLVAIFFYLIFNFVDVEANVNVIYTLKKIGGLLILLLLFYILNFILIKDKSKGRHTYVLLFFCLFSISNAAIYKDIYLIISGLFIVLSLHRVLSMQTGQKLNRKIFDSSFFIACAGLLFPPALIFLLIPILGVLYFSPENYKNWLIPIPALLSVWVLKTCYDLLRYDHFFNPLNLFDFSPISVSDYFSLEALIPLGFISLFSLWALASILTADIKLTQAQKRGNLLLVVNFVVSFVVFYFSASSIEHQNSALLFPYIAGALVGGRYYEIPGKERLKEILLIILIIVSLSFAVISKWHLI